MEFIKKKYTKKNNGQSFSTDILVVVVILLVSALFLVMNKVNDESKGPDLNELSAIAAEDSKIIVEDLKASTVIDSENNVEIDSLLQIDIEELRDRLNIDSDFCIVFEKDGNLVKIDPENDITGIGSENIVVNGVACKSS